MHIHGSPNLNSGNINSLAGAEKAAEAQRAADVRKRLLKSAQNADGELSSEETVFISHWLNAGQNESQNDQNSHQSGNNSSQYPYFR